MITVVVVLIALIILAVVIGVVVMGARRPVPVESGADDFEDGVVSEPVPIASSTSAHGADHYNPHDLVLVHNDSIAAAMPTADEGQVRWTKQFEPRFGALSGEARLQLIDDLGMLGAPWCIPILAEALDQEKDPGYRVAAQRALTRCRKGKAISIGSSDLGSRSQN